MSIGMERTTIKNTIKKVIGKIYKFIIIYIELIYNLRSIKMKLKFYLIIVCLLVFGCNSSEKPIYIDIEKKGIVTEENGIYYLKVEISSVSIETITEIYELIVPKGSLSHEVNDAIIVHGKLITVGNVKKIYVIEIESIPIY